MRGATRYAARRLMYITVFQSTLLMRGATSCDTSYSFWLSAFQSTLLMRGATGTKVGMYYDAVGISIHAPHARSDSESACPDCVDQHFNPRSSCEERQLSLSCSVEDGISIHAPHARSDNRKGCDSLSQRISIHAPHARSDRSSSMLGTIRAYFNPRSSCEERHGADKEMRAGIVFQSTLLMRGATQCRRQCRDGHLISIHAPHARSDGRHHGGGQRGSDFNPRSSCEERRG